MIHKAILNPALNMTPQLPQPGRQIGPGPRREHVFDTGPGPKFPLVQIPPGAQTGSSVHQGRADRDAIVVGSRFGGEVGSGVNCGPQLGAGGGRVRLTKKDRDLMNNPPILIPHK